MVRRYVSHWMTIKRVIKAKRLLAQPASAVLPAVLPKREWYIARRALGLEPTGGLEAQ